MLNRSSSLGALALAVLMAAAVGCSDSPTDVHSSPSSLSVLCVPANRQVSCTATFFDGRSGVQRDVTASATWSASDPAVGFFERPGLFTPRQKGEVNLSARFQQEEPHYDSWFLVDPQQPAQRLYFVSGLITDATSGTLLAGVTVEILDGYARGMRAVTNENGHYQIDKVLTGETFSARASMPGYAPLTQTYRVDSPIGPPNSNSPFLDFKLQRRE